MFCLSSLKTVVYSCELTENEGTEMADDTKQRSPDVNQGCYDNTIGFLNPYEKQCIKMKHKAVA